MKDISSVVSWLVGTRETTAETCSLQDPKAFRSQVCTSTGRGIGGDIIAPKRAPQRTGLSAYSDQNITLWCLGEAARDGYFRVRHARFERDIEAGKRTGDRAERVGVRVQRELVGGQSPR